ncbi:MAG: hypothetical protein H7144_07625 [Burkholderiales bacterium]|nr:hypothetical protein [Phycisphaerae bacterium]
MAYAQPYFRNLSTLPSLARAAFAARCGRRVLPIFQDVSIYQSDLDSLHSVMKVLEFAERVSSSGVDQGDAVVSVLAAAQIFNTGTEEVRASVAAAKAIVAAGHTARIAQLIPGIKAEISSGKKNPVALSDVDHTLFTTAQDAAALSIRAAIMHNPDSSQLIEQAILFDVELLKLLARTENWTDTTLVPPECFGPLWPDSEPDNWPVTYDESPDDLGTPKIHIEFTLPAELDENEASRVISSLLRRASDLHLAFGGNGLVITDSHSYEPELIEEPVGGAR